MSTATQNAILLGIEWIHMSWTSEGLWGRVGICQCLDGFSTVVGRNTSSAALQFVYSHRERSAQYAGVVLHLMRQVQFLAALDCDGGAEHATRILQHEVHLFCRDHFCGDDEVAFVFTVFVINYDDKFTLSKVFNGFLYSV